MNWRNRKKRVRRGNTDINLYMTYLSYEGIYDAFLQYRDTRNIFFSGSIKAFNKIKRFECEDQVNLYQAFIQEQLTKCGANMTGDYIEFASNNPSIPTEKTATKKEKELWELVGAMCATQYIITHVKKYKEDYHGND